MEHMTFLRQAYDLLIFQTFKDVLKTRKHVKGALNLKALLL